MSVTTGNFIQLLQLIVLAFTAVVFISQFILRLFISDRAMELVKSTKGDEAIGKLKNGVKTFFLSIGFFAFSGTLLSVYLILVAVPGEVDFFLSVFETYWYVFGIAILLMVLGAALIIGGKTETFHTGIKGVVIGTFLAGGFSLFIIIVYVVLLAATRSPEWIFFISTVCLAVAMFSFLYGSLVMSETILDVIEDIDEPQG